MKIRPVGAQLFHADGHYEANSHFSQFCERAKNLRQCIIPNDGPAGPKHVAIKYGCH